LLDTPNNTTNVGAVKFGREEAFANLNHFIYGLKKNNPQYSGSASEADQVLTNA